MEPTRNSDRAAKGSLVSVLDSVTPVQLGCVRVFRWAAPLVRAAGNDGCLGDALSAARVIYYIEWFGAIQNPNLDRALINADIIGPPTRGQLLRYFSTDKALAKSRTAFGSAE